jgi:HAD superfamily hydrolase (TIGR01509 family)
MLSMSVVPESETYSATFEDPIMEEAHDEILDAETTKEKKLLHQLEAWQLEAAGVDRSVRILPGVKRIMNSIPKGKYAVATSGAKTYAYGCMTRVGITPPPVTITADDKRLKNGKPFPDPFLLAAKELGYDATKCVVFEDSPSGIRAGVASGATVIAVCTSHERSKIENCGAHYLVENMDKIHCEVVGDQLKFTVEA